MNFTQPAFGHARHRLVPVLLLGLFVLLGWSESTDGDQPADSADSVDTASDNLGLSAEELLAEAPENATTDYGAINPELSRLDPTEMPDELPVESVSIEEAQLPLSITYIAAQGYMNADNDMIIDLMEQDIVYLSIMVEDATGRPVEAANPTVAVEGDSKIQHLYNETPATNRDGSMMFGVIGGSMGEQPITVSLNDTSETAYLNVISIAASGYSNLSNIEGVLGWDKLMQAKISWDEEAVRADLSPEIEKKNGKTIKLAGFMMPLGMSPKQSNFVLTSNPADCFFHVPGGPAGAVEVLASKPIKLSWEPIVIQGRLEANETSDDGVIYRLHDARLVK